MPCVIYLLSRDTHPPAKDMEINMNTIKGLVLILGLSLSLSNAFAQSLSLKNGESASVSCERGTVLEVNNNGRDATLNCTRACYENLKTVDAYQCDSGYGYCVETSYPSGMVADTCGAKVICNQAAAISYLRSYANRDVSVGNCEKAILNF
jgi:hypothetical protein